jgi:hypothetical protein
MLVIHTPAEHAVIAKQQFQQSGTSFSKNCAETKFDSAKLVSAKVC